MYRKIFLTFIVLFIGIVPTAIAEPPGYIADIIKANAEKKWPGNYSMQEFTINKQLKAYDFIEDYENRDVPYDVTLEIKEKAAWKWPENYTMQKFTIEKQVNAWLKINR